MPVQEIFAVLVGPVQNIFSSPYTFSIPLSPLPSKLGRQPCWVAYLLLCVSCGDRFSKGIREIFETKMFIRKIKDSRLDVGKISLHKLMLLANGRKQVK